jgi:hypothetical protein
VRLSAAQFRGGMNVRNVRLYDRTPRLESRCGMRRFRCESSHTRIRTYTLAPRKRTRTIAIVGRWLAAGAGCGVDAARTTRVASVEAVVEPARFVAVMTTLWCARRRGRERHSSSR